MTDEENRRNADWLATKRLFMSAEGASAHDVLEMKRSEKLAALGALTTFPAGYYISGFEGAEDQRHSFVTVAATDDGFVFLDGDLEPDPTRELGRVPRSGLKVTVEPLPPGSAAGREFVPAVSGEGVGPRWQRRFDVSCRLLLSWGDGEGTVVLAFGSEEGGREAESRFLNRVPPPRTDLGRSL